MRRNLTIGYILAGLMKTQFWLAIWLFFFLRVTDYAGIGIIMSVSILAGLIAEIPTGAIADMLGKKKTLITAFAFTAVGEYAMSQITDLNGAIISGIIIFIGYALYSGSLEALMYDTLVEHKAEKMYSKVVGSMSTIRIAAMAISSVIGGYLYTYNPAYPYIGVAIFRVIGCALAFFLIEPAVDTEVFSLKAFIAQNKRGFMNLFSPKNLSLSLLALALGIFFVINWEILDDTLVIEYGYSPEGIGILYAGLTVLGTLLALSYSRVIKRIKPPMLLIITSVVYMVTLLITPWTGIILGTALLVVRLPLDPYYNNSVSEIINHRIESRDRATTLSTFSLITRIPYMFIAFFVGASMEEISAKGFSFYYAIVMSVVLIPLIVLYLRSRKMSLSLLDSHSKS